MHKLLNCMQCNLFNIISKKLLISYYLFFMKKDAVTVLHFMTSVRKVREKRELKKTEKGV